MNIFLERKNYCSSVYLLVMFLLEPGECRNVVVCVNGRLYISFLKPVVTLEFAITIYI